MDQDTVVADQADSGKRLIDLLGLEAFPISTAFWAKPTDDGKWFLYLASSVVDELGHRAAYRTVHRVIRGTPDLWIDPFEVRVIGANNSLAVAAIEATKPKIPTSTFAVKNPNPKPYPGMTRFEGSTLGGVSIDGAFIYPPPQRSVPA